MAAYIRLDRPCPTCKADHAVLIDVSSSFVTAEYIDVPGYCDACKEELRVTYDFSLLQVDALLDKEPENASK